MPLLSDIGHCVPCPLLIRLVRDLSVLLIFGKQLSVSLTFLHYFPLFCFTKLIYTLTFIISFHLFILDLTCSSFSSFFKWRWGHWFVVGKVNPVHYSFLPGDRNLQLPYLTGRLSQFVLVHLWITYVSYQLKV